MPDDEKHSEWLTRTQIVDKLSELEKKVSEMKEWENYLAHGGLLEQIMEKVEKLFKTVHGIAPDDVDNLQERIEKLEKDKDGEKSVDKTHPQGRAVPENSAHSMDTDSTPSKDKYDELFGKDANYWRTADKILKEKEPTESMIPEKTIIKLQEYGIMKFLEEDDIVVKKADLEFLIKASNRYYLRDGFGVNYDRAESLKEKYLEEDEKVDG